MSLRILHITHSLCFGGVESQLALLAEADSRDEHRFCAIHEGGEAAGSIKTSGKDAQAIGVDPWRNPISALIKLAHFIRSSRPDIVHCHGYEANIWAAAAARLAGVNNVVAEEIGIWDRSWRSRAVIRTAYRFARRIIATSNAVQEFLVQDGVPLSKISIVHNPVRFSSLAAQPRPAGSKLHVACVGRLHLVKNPTALVQVTNLLHAKGLEIETHFVGDGPLRSELEKMVSDLGLGSSIHFHGYQTDPFKILAQCHLYVQPSPAEGFGIALVEAMSCGLPVICARSGAAPEIVKDRRHGWLLEDVEPETIANAVLTAASLEPERLYKMGVEANQNARRRFTSAIYVEMLEQLYDGLAR